MATRNSLRLFNFFGKNRNKHFENLSEDKKYIEMVMQANEMNWTNFMKKTKKVIARERKKNRKSETKARKAIGEGKAFLKEKNYEQALEKFSQAILFVPTKQPNLLLAQTYLLRSFVHLLKKEYQYSFDDADRALKVIPQDSYNFIYELKSKKVMCLISLKQTGKAKILFAELAADEKFVELIGKENVAKYVKDFEALQTNEAEEEEEDQNEELYYKNKKVEIKHADDNGGRHMVAIHDIKKMESIVKEVAAAHAIYVDYFLEFCTHCCKEIKNNFVPCKNCSQVIFCDENCRREAWNYYHRYECQIANLLVDYSPNTAMALRTVLLLGPKNCIRFQKKQFDKIEDVSENILKNYKVMSSLLSHRDKQSSNSMFTVTTKAIEMTCILDQLNLLLPERSFLKKLERRNKLTEMCSILINNHLRCNINAFGIFIFKDDEPEKRVHLGNVLAPFSSCINHSCDPNVFWSMTGNRVSMVARKDIKAGEELTISYGPIKSHPLKERRQKLQKSYFFICQCLACLREQKLVDKVVAQQMLDDVLNSVPETRKK